MLEMNDVRNPFPGLRPFETDENNLFFGRDGQSDELLERLRRARFLAVVGTSGSGKSSLIRAGLLPALYGGLMGDAGSSWRIAIHRPGGDPIGNLAEALARKDIFGAENNSEIQKTLIETTLRRSSIGLIDVARQARMQPHENLLVVVDQFEELFRFKQAQSGDDATAFVKLLLEAGAQSELPIYIVLTMRSDFLGDCSQFAGLPEAINKGQYLIPRMSRDERRSAIVGPVAVGAAEISIPLVNRLLNDVGDNPDQLPILQHALMRTWDYWAAHRRNGQPIALEDYESIGGMAEALSLHADEAWAELPTERSRQVAEKLFKELTEKGADNRETRRPTQLSEICGSTEATTEEVSEVIEVFRREGRSFLMPPAGVHLAADTVIDISHESLIRNWYRLQTWVDEEAQSARIYHRLAESAVLHRDGKEGLLIDPALQIALDWRDKNKPNSAWASRYHSEFNEALAYLEESRAARAAALAEADRRRNEELVRERREREQAEMYAAQQLNAARRLRRFSYALVLISILALGAAGGAVYAFSVAKRNENSALEERKNALIEQEKSRAAQAEAEALNIQLKQNKKDLESKRTELERSVDAYKASEKERQRQTDIAKERAEAAQRAEKEAQNEAATAVAARKIAEGNAERGTLLRDGLESLQRGDYDLARFSLEALADSLGNTLKDPNRQLSKADVQRLTVDLGWAHAHVGNAWLGTDDFTAARNSYEKARDILERFGPKQENDPLDPEPVLYETYNGLGKTYQLIGGAGYDSSDGRQQKIDPITYFKKAETLYAEALKYHEKLYSQVQMQLQLVEARGIAEGHTNLAHLYRDMGETAKAEQHFKALVEFAYGGDDEVFAARRELAEFYRDQNRYDEAVKAYTDLISQQEQVIKEEEDYARHGQEIANNYSELADAYRGLADASNGQDKVDKTDKADDTFAVSVALQRFAIRLRRQLAAPDAAGATDRDELADALGDAYVQIGRFDRAAALYQYARKIRINGEPRELPASYDKLAKLYSIQKDYAKAEESYNALLGLYSKRTKGAQYANVLLALASVYAQDPNAPPDAAVGNYQKALAVYQDLGDWYAQDLVLYRLAKLSEKSEPKARAQAMQNRVTALAGYYAELVAGKPIKPNDPTKLVTEYLQSINALAYFFKPIDPSAAAAAYQRAFDMHAYLQGHFKVDKDEKMLKFYAAVLGDYQALLVETKSPLASEVAKVAQNLRDDLNRNEEQKLTKTAQAAAAQ